MLSKRPAHKEAKARRRRPDACGMIYKATRNLQLHCYARRREREHWRTGLKFLRVIYKQLQSGTVLHSLSAAAERSCCLLSRGDSAQNNLSPHAAYWLKKIILSVQVFSCNFVFVEVPQENVKKTEGELFVLSTA